MEPARQFSQLLQRLAELLCGAGQERLQRLRPGAELRAREPQRQRQRDEPLLRAVVQVAFEPATLLVARLDDAGARRLQVLACLRARDRERDELAERHQPGFAVGRQPLGCGDGDGAPRHAADEDRGRDRRAVADISHRPRHVGVDRVVVLDARRQGAVACAADRGVVVGQDPVPDLEDAHAVAVVSADDGRGIVALVAEDR